MKRGQSLVEVLVAIGIATLLGVALLSTAVLTQKASRSAQNTANATKLVQEMLEELRIFRDQSSGKVGAFPSALTAGKSGCYVLSGAKTSGALNLAPGNFDANGNLTWVFTPIVSVGVGVTCPVANDSLPLTSNIEKIPSNKVDFYRYILFKKDAATTPPGLEGLTATVNVSWQEQSGWRTIADDVYLTTWCGASAVTCGP